MRSTRWGRFGSKAVVGRLESADNGEKKRSDGRRQPALKGLAWSPPSAGKPRKTGLSEGYVHLIRGPSSISLRRFRRGPALAVRARSLGAASGTVPRSRFGLKGLVSTTGTIPRSRFIAVPQFPRGSRGFPQFQIGRNAFSVGTVGGPSPRVGRGGGQPWAMGRNAVGVYCDAAPHWRCVHIPSLARRAQGVAGTSGSEGRGACGAGTFAQPALYEGQELVQQRAISVLADHGAPHTRGDVGPGRIVGQKPLGQRLELVR